VSALRIAVSFKVTPDYEALRPADWARVETAGLDGTSGSGPDVRFVRRVLGPFDEAALELALRVRDARAERGLETNLAAFTVGGREAEPFLATLQALGYDRVCRAEAGATSDFAPVATAALVAACTERLGGDVLLLGAQSGPGDSGVVPFFAAGALGRQCLTQITEIEAQDGDGLTVTWTTARCRLRARMAPPCVLGVGNALVSMLRVPTLKDRLAARERTVEVWTPAELGVELDEALTREPSALLELSVVDRRRAGRVIPGASAKEKARALYEAELRSRLERRP
jgi:electron transfer flavoprotein beta subunit